MSGTFVDGLVGMPEYMWFALLLRPLVWADLIPVVALCVTFVVLIRDHAARHGRTQTLAMYCLAACTSGAVLETLTTVDYSFVSPRAQLSWLFFVLAIAVCLVWFTVEDLVDRWRRRQR
ncbi:hypothetical protein C1Y63_12095 [Corynebacterium sp. 13CS0277]|nr:hypothetical protein C1Y63_12095 [Corynebacterium sp. 13CS0277]